MRSTLRHVAFAIFVTVVVIAIMTLIGEQTGNSLFGDNSSEQPSSIQVDLDYEIIPMDPEDSCPECPPMDGWPQTANDDVTFQVCPAPYVLSPHTGSCDWMEA